jgi:hypothetical protein
MDRVKLQKRDIQFFLDRTFPNYRGRTFSAQVRETYNMEDYWSGGTRYYCRFVTSDGTTFSAPVGTTNPFNRIAHVSFPIPKNVMVVENCIFCGKDLGVRFFVSPGSDFLPKMFPMPKEG